MSLSLERYEERVEKTEEHISILVAAIERLLKEGYLDPRLLCVLQAKQALESLPSIR